MLKLNPDTNHVKKIINSIVSKGGHCPYILIQDKNSICSFDEYYHPEQITFNMLCGNGIKDGECKCKLYIKEGEAIE